MDSNRTTQSESHNLPRLTINKESSKDWLLYSDPFGKIEGSVTSNHLQVVST